MSPIKGDPEWMNMCLHTYWRSSAAYRVRIALNLKGLPYNSKAIDLSKHEHWDQDYGKINPQHVVPTLSCGNLLHFGQSLAIMEYLEERHPDPPLLPRGLADRAFVRQLAQIIACDVHPLQNMRVQEYLGEELGAKEGDVLSWCRSWIDTGFSAYEKLLEREGGHPIQFYNRFSFGSSPTLADCCLMPQVWNAESRFKMQIWQYYPRIFQVSKTCMKMDAFKKAAPENQPDAPKKDA